MREAAVKDLLAVAVPLHPARVALFPVAMAAEVAAAKVAELAELRLVARADALIVAAGVEVEVEVEAITASMKTKTLATAETAAALAIALIRRARTQATRRREQTTRVKTAEEPAKLAMAGVVKKTISQISRRQYLAQTVKV